jgi:endonuclease/exonuclease/phosphatase family metal-dependent hydrolase
MNNQITQITHPALGNIAEGKKLPGAKMVEKSPGLIEEAVFFIIRPAIHALVAAIVLSPFAPLFLGIGKAEATSEVSSSSTSQASAPPSTSIVDPAPQEAQVRVLAWNLQFYPGRSPGPLPEQVSAHKACAKHQLKQISPEIFLAQEIRTWADFNELVSSLPNMQPVIVSSFRDRGKIAMLQTAIASKWPAKAAWYEDWKQAPSTPPRGLTAAVLEVPDSNKLLLVYSIHLKSNSGHRDGMAKTNYLRREESVRQLIAHIGDMERLFEGRISGVIVGGDFNTNHDGQFADKTISMMVEAGFHNTWLETPPEARQTWRGSQRFRPTTLDYFFTKGIAPLRAKIIDTDCSDHRPFEISVPLSELSD